MIAASIYVILFEYSVKMRELGPVPAGSIEVLRTFHNWGTSPYTSLFGRTRAKALAHGSLFTYSAYLVSFYSRLVFRELDIPHIPTRCDIGFVIISLL